MPVLNSDYFTNISIQCLKKDNDTRTLGKFLLAGREPFHAALNYFKKVKYVEICDSLMRVYVKIGGVTHKHEISYQFSMIYLIMKAIAPSLEEMNILKCPESFDAIEFFLKHKIKKVAVLQWLPEKYRKAIASCNSIEKINLCIPVPLDMIPPSCQYMDKTIKLSTEYLKNIEKLEIDAHSSFPKRYISSFILNNFPKLQSVEMVATYHENIKYVIEMFSDKELKFLEKLKKSKITGKLVFKNSIPPYSRKVIPAFKQVLQDVRDIPKITSDVEHKTITRTVELKENLVVEFKLFFNNFEYYKNL